MYLLHEVSDLNIDPELAQLQTNGLAVQDCILVAQNKYW